MDSQRFDELARVLAGTRSRRAVLRSLAGGAAGGMLAVLGIGEAAAQSCRTAGKLCNKDGHCCSGICDTANPDPSKRNRCAAGCAQDAPRCGGVCMPGEGCCIDGNFVAAGTPNPSNVCQACQPGVSGTGYSNRPNGSTCEDDGDLCTIDQCVDGTCVHAPVTCPQSTPCQSWRCARATGECVADPPRTCDDNDPCTIDSCDDSAPDGQNPCVNTPITCVGTGDPCLGVRCTINAGGCYLYPVPNGEQGGCSAGFTCQDGQGCVQTCSSGSSGDCSGTGTCTDLSTDPDNCGACGNVCHVSDRPGSTCVGGTCQCPQGHFACPDRCLERCDADPGGFREGFRFCLGGNSCEYCTGRVVCYGTLDTYTHCGTITRGC